MSVQAMSYVIDNSKHKGSDLLTLLMIANHAHADGTGAWPSIATLAKETRMSERGVQYCLEVLKQSGELVVIPDGGPRGCNSYSIPMTQSLRQTKNVMTQESAPMTQESAPRDAIAIAPKPSLTVIEPSAAAPLYPHYLSEEKVKIRKDYEQRRWQVDQAGKRFLVSPSTGGRVYEEAI